MDDKYFMKMALDLALKGQGYTSPNPMVGTVIVRETTVVGKGYHHAAGQAHAEINALADAGDAAREATLYVNLEPCNHTGRTPPCTESIIAAGIRRVVVGMADPNPDVTGGGAAHLAQHGIEVLTGVCEEEARKLNEVFEKFVLTKRPFVYLKCAATLDGRIATRTGDSRWVTGPEARRSVHRLRHAADGIMVGVNTVQIDNPRLTARLQDHPGLDPVRIVLDTHLRIPEDAKLLRVKSDSDTIIVVSESAPGEKKARLLAAGARVIAAPLKEGRIDMDRLMNRLGALGITSLLIEGGSRVAASALRAGVVDKVFFFFAPKILGGDDGVPICRGSGPELMEECIPVTGVQVRKIGEDVLIEGYIAR